MKFSIITITYNRGHIIGKTIQSVIDQTYKNYEHIIIDDGSTDNTQDVITKINNDKIKYFKYEKHTHRSFLRNEGIKRSSGEFICILDSDDIWDKEKLSVISKIFKNTNVHFVIHNVQLYNVNGTNTGTIYSYKDDFFKNILKLILDNEILPFAFYSFRRSLLENNDIYDENMIDGQHDFFLRIASNHPFFYSSKILAYRKAYEDGVSNNFRVSALINFNTSLEKLYSNEKIAPTYYRLLNNRNDIKIIRFYLNQNEFENSLNYVNALLKRNSNSIMCLKYLILKLRIKFLNYIKNNTFHKLFSLNPKNE